MQLGMLWRREAIAETSASFVLIPSLRASIFKFDSIENNCIQENAFESTVNRLVIWEDQGFF